MGGAVAAILASWALAFFSKVFRDRFWVPLGNALRWPFTLRITTVNRIRKAGEAVTRLGRENERLRADVEKATNLGAAHVAATQELAKQELQAAQAQAKYEALEQVRRGGELAETAREYGRMQGRAEAMAEVEAERAAPQLQPQWRIEDVKDSDIFVLKNTQPSVHISDVSLLPPMGDFAFSGPSQWPGAMENAIIFHGERQANGRSFGVRFVVRWRDLNGDHKVGEIFLDKEQRRMTVL
ncbi:hypothetical protein [Microbacterium sp. AK031]|uniref:hypothetical protein n=1 Tax=Microbacterium sp. AK031 TaxID=2723076 RepID=UPI0021679B4F|nr:hypothetical protein [Microbacterium sp. AK031]MCS3844802.1 hypothetical protein [Microbacterium sp. AK031]